MRFINKNTLARITALAVTITSLGMFPGVRSVVAAGTDPVLLDDGSITICIDPGHGGTDSGAVEKNSSGAKVTNGLKEKDLTLKIATYCKEELEKYAKVNVVMTRDTDKTIASLGDRTDFAKKAGADAFVSIHINSATSSLARGAETWYPNSNGNASIGAKGKTLGENVQNSLIAAHTDENGINQLYNRKANYLNSKNGSTYSDGKLSDYYGVIRLSKLAGFPGIIVEHGFITSEFDVKHFFSTEEALRKLGAADAAGIVKTYNLKLKSQSGSRPGYTTLGDINSGGKYNDVYISWVAATDADEYVIFRKKGKSGTYTEIGRTTDTTFTDTKAASATTYYYTVIANNAAGKATSYDTAGLKIKTAAWNTEVTSVTDGGLRKAVLTWNVVDGADGYRIYRCVSTGTSYSKVDDVSGSTLTYTDTTVERSTGYYYMVKPYHLVDGKQVFGNAVKPGMLIETDTDSITMEPLVMDADGNVTVTWTSVGDDSSYRVYRKEKGGTYEKIKQTKKFKFKDTDTEEGVTYNYRVRACRKENGKYVYGVYTASQKVTTPESEPEPEVTETPGTTEVTTPSTVDTKSQEQTASAVKKKKVSYPDTVLEVKSLSDAGLRKVKVKWTKVSGAEGYKIYRKADGESKFTAIADTLSNVKTYVDPTVSKNKTYIYRLRAYKTENKKRVYTKTDKTGKAITTDNDSFAITGVSDIKMGSASVAFEGVKDADVTYQIRRRGTEDTAYTLLGTTTELSYTDEASVLPKTGYVYRIRGYREQDGKKIYTPYTEEYSFTASDYKITVPEKCAEAGQNSSLVITWNSAEGATGYELYRKNDKGKWKNIGTPATNTYTDTGLKSTTDYTYRVRSYIVLGDTNYYGEYSDAFTGNTGYTILGESNVSVSRMVSYFNSKGKTYPGDVYKKYGAPTLQDFCKMVYNISKQNEVRAEVVFAQICVETGYLQFGHDVEADQCNFAGMGTTGGGVKGVDFGDADWKTKYPSLIKSKKIDYDNRTINKNGVHDGILAQVRHLRGYAVSDKTLCDNADGADPRYFTGTFIGKAPYVEWLCIPNNPNGTGWAAGANYSTTLPNIIWELRS